MGWLLGELAGWTILAALVYAPWALGGKPVWAARHLEIGAAVGACLWLASLLLLRRRPTAPRLALWCVALLLALGWGMTLNAGSRYDARAKEFIAVKAPVAALPGSVGALTSHIEMTQVSALF